MVNCGGYEPAGQHIPCDLRGPSRVERGEVRGTQFECEIECNRNVLSKEQCQSPALCEAVESGEKEKVGELEESGGKMYYCCPPALGVDEEQWKESPPGGWSAGQGFVEDPTAEGR